MSIKGPARLTGSVTVQASKNAGQKVLPALAAFDGRFTLLNCSLVGDNRVLIDILKLLGAEVRLDGSTLHVDTRGVRNTPIPLALTRRSTGTFLFAGALLRRFGSVRLGAPGGDELGPRPVDFHLAAFEAMGARWHAEDDYYDIAMVAPRPADFAFPRASANGTMNAAILGSGMPGRSVLRGIDWDPDIENGVGFLRAAGTAVENLSGAQGLGLAIEGSEPAERVTAEWRLIADHNDAMTWLCCATITGGDMFIAGAPIAHLGAGLDLLQELGARFEVDSAMGLIAVRPTDGLCSDGLDIVTGAFPGVSSDWGPMLQAVLTQAEGSCFFTETVFAKRYSQVPELVRMGADIAVVPDRHVSRYRFPSDADSGGHTLRITGQRRLSGTDVNAANIRAGASLVVAALAAVGATTIHGATHLLRGYENLPGRLGSLGADIAVENYDDGHV